MKKKRLLTAVGFEPGNFRFKGERATRALFSCNKFSLKNQDWIILGGGYDNPVPCLIAWKSCHA